MPFSPDLSEKAQEHYAFVLKNLAADTSRAIEETEIYGPEFPSLSMAKPPRREHIVLTPQDSVSCLFNTPLPGKVAILNYADYEKPGGCFLEGSKAQEEALCHVSNLYPILLSFKDSYYKWNKRYPNMGLYLDRALYTPDVKFIKDEAVTRADVITCAAPNLNAASYRDVSKEENLEVFRQRVRFMNAVARDNGVKTLICGAWGCGVFGQDPAQTCRLLLDELTIPNIYFAIPNANSKNYKAFKSVLEERS